MAAVEPMTNMVSRSTQTDPEPTPFEDSWLEEPLGHTAIDPHGRRSMAYRRKATGEIVTQTELDEVTIEDQPMKNSFRHQDAYMCFTMMEDVRSPRLRSFFQWMNLATPMVPWLFYNNLMLRWDMKMEERRKRSQAEEEER